MKKITRLFAVALSVLLVTVAVAPVSAAGDRSHDRGRHGWNDRGRGPERGWRDGRRHYDAGYRTGYRDARYDTRRYYAPPPPRVVYRPYGFQRGHGYRNYYGGPVYVVNDYGRYRLRAPPQGHRWIRDDRGNLLMVAIATGIIADIVLNH
ncbi:RcnB family protein [Stenotrophomonas mori]|uniref:RcnB family protein n=1 Tax=Stenotrophomonas mori TaxID=2871096 RepID=A0ABT0SJT4_9GAMM|nr:RcnB family protein [Stenotrophomonas mori]MCL7715586.1 RcnB family protein [Stenotrophomonas mori]